MDSNQEKKMLEAIRESAENVEIPEGLKPMWVQDSLGDKRGHRKPRRSRIYALASAAVLVIAVMGVWTAGALKMGNTGDETFKEASAPKGTDATVADDAQKNAVEKPVEELAGEKDYRRIYELVKSDYRSDDIIKEKETKKSEEALTDSSFGAAAGGGAARSEHSDTNIQTKGVDEGDVVKNDGRCIYYMDKSASSIYIIDGKAGKAGALKEISRINVDDTDEGIEEMYLSGSRLVVVSGYVKKVEKKIMGFLPGDECYKSRTRIRIYDVSNRAKPKKAGELTMDGAPDSSRLAGDYLYVFTTYSTLIKPIYRDKQTYLPTVDGQSLKCGDIYVPEDGEGGCYTTVASIDITNPEKVLASKSVLAANATYYVSEQSIYVACANYDSRVQRTELFKFSYKDGRLRAEGKTKVKGFVNDSFSMDEYDGHLRMVVTEERPRSSTGSAQMEDTLYAEDMTYNSLYVLDEGLKVVGSIQNLAKGERIKSARFMGAIGYFVTFRDIDPLFSVDLKEPSAPKIIGELKVTGFSEYLHFYDENLLLGIGEEVPIKANAASGIKLSMFDISNPKKVTEKHKKVFTDYPYADALYNHHAVFIQPERNLFGFVLSGGDGEDKWVLYRYDADKGFEQVMQKKNLPGYNARGLYMDEVFYLVMEGKAYAYSMKDYKEISAINLKP